MTRLYGALLISTFVGLAACGSNGNGDSHACGDGIVNGNEQCDDGNTVSGDGCSSVCTKELGKCGDGIVDVATETCDDGNTVSGDGCSSTCQTETSTKCGNGTLDSGEACDDGNTASSDGCSSTCQVESGYMCAGTPSVCTMNGGGSGSATGAGTCATPIAMTLTNGTGTATGDSTSATDQVAGDCDGYGGDTLGTAQVVKFTLAAAADVDIELTSAFDAGLRVTTVACDVTTSISDHLWHDGCADQIYIDGNESMTAQSLPAGDYYIVVEGIGDTDVGTWSLTVTTTAPTAVCGNGVYDDNEECDAGATSSTRCDTNCKLISNTAEVEPNDDLAHAQVITPANHIIRGSFASDTDFDLYTFTLTAAATVNFETYDAIDPQHTYAGSGTLTSVACKAQHTYLNLFDSTGDVTDDLTSIFYDDFEGDSDADDGAQCSYIGPQTLQPGTYTLKIEDEYGSAEKEYILDVNFGAGVAAVAPGAGDLKINEVMLADGTTADTNCDGSFTDTVDEFVELVNVTDHPLDLTGVTISDAMQVRHTFAAGTSGSMTLEAGKAMVVWGGGAPACPGVTNWFTASTGSLGLNDAGDTVTVKAGTTTVATATFGLSTTGKSFNASPDITGTTYAVHDTITGHSGAFTPGKKNDGTAF